MIRNFGSRERHNIPHKHMLIPKILDISLLREGVPFTGKDTSASVCLKSQANTANPSEQVDEPETMLLVSGRLHDSRHVKHASQSRFEHDRARNLSNFPPTNGLWSLAYKISNFALSKSAACLLEQLG